jgi:hypothetical protein
MRVAQALLIAAVVATSLLVPPIGAAASADDRQHRYATQLRHDLGFRDDASYVAQAEANASWSNRYGPRLSPAEEVEFARRLLLQDKIGPLLDS